MSRLMNALDIVVVILCLPIYALMWPFTQWEVCRAVRRIIGLPCPACGARIEGFHSADLHFCGVRLRLTPGTNVEWANPRRTTDPI